MKLLFPLLACVSLLAAIAHGSPLEQEMKTLGRTVKALSKQISEKDQKQSSLELVATLKKAAERSKNLTPSKAKEIPEAQRESFIADYRKGMEKLSAELAKIQAALEADKFQEAATLFDGLKQVKREGHEKFASED